jgi:hypothetical protein
MSELLRGARRDRINVSTTEPRQRRAHAAPVLRFTLSVESDEKERGWEAEGKRCAISLTTKEGADPVQRPAMRL